MGAHLHIKILGPIHKRRKRKKKFIHSLGLESNTRQVSYKTLVFVMMVVVVDVHLTCPYACGGEHAIGWHVSSDSICLRIVVMSPIGKRRRKKAFHHYWRWMEIEFGIVSASCRCDLAGLNGPINKASSCMRATSPAQNRLDRPVRPFENLGAELVNNNQWPTRKSWDIKCASTSLYTPPLPLPIWINGPSFPMHHLTRRCCSLLE